MFRPAHVSEKFAGLTKFDECGPCSGIMLANSYAGANIHPGTEAECDAIRELGGLPESGAVSAYQLRNGINARYDIPVAIVETFALVWPKLKPGVGAVVVGHLSNFPSGHRLRRGQFSYTGGHDVYVQREGPEERVWWIDPLIAPGTGYTGEWVTKAELATFLSTSTGDTAIYVTLPQEQDVNLTAVVAQRWTANGVNGVLRAEPKRGAPIVATVPAGGEVISYGEYFDAVTVNSWRAVRYPATSPTPLWLLRFGPGVAKDHDFIAGSLVPVPGLSQSDIDAAVAPLISRINAAKSALA